MYQCVITVATFAAADDDDYDDGRTAYGDLTMDEHAAVDHS